MLYASKHAAVSAVEAVEIEKLKACAHHFLNTKLKISLLHKTATSLWPQFCQLHMLPENERLDVCTHIRELLARVNETMAQDEDETNDDAREPALKRRCLGLFQDWCDEEDGKAATDELEECLHGKKDYSCSGVSELCDFSRVHEKEIPKLSSLRPNKSCASLLQVLAANRTSAQRDASKMGLPEGRVHGKFVSAQKHLARSEKRNERCNICSKIV